MSNPGVHQKKSTHHKFEKYMYTAHAQLILSHVCSCTFLVVPGSEQLPCLRLSQLGKSLVQNSYPILVSMSDDEISSGEEAYEEDVAASRKRTRSTTTKFKDSSYFRKEEKLKSDMKDSK